MASGDPVVQIVDVWPPATSAAGLTRIAGTSTPAEAANVWAFDQNADEFLDFLCVLRGYDGGGLTFAIKSSAAVATNNAIIGLAIRRIQDDAEDFDTTAHTYDFNEATVGAASAVGELTYDNITFTDGADMDSLAEGEMFILRLRRNADDASDNMGGDWYFWGLDGRET